MKHLIAGAVTTALIATTSLTPVQAAPLSVAAGSTVTPPVTLTDVRYRAHKAHKPIRRHVRRHYRGGNAVAAAALGLFGAALAGAIASSRYDDDYYYGPSYYYPGYSYGYARPRAYYRPGWGGGARWAGGGWRGGGFRGGGFHAGGPRIGGFHGGGFHGGGFHGGGHRH